MPAKSLSAHLAAATNRVGRRLTPDEREAAEAEFNTAEPPPTIYTVPDAARHLGRSFATIQRHAETLGVGFASVGGTQLFTAADVATMRAYQPKTGPKVAASQPPRPQAEPDTGGTRGSSRRRP